MDEKPVILVVDDDGPILTLMRNLLREFGFQAATAADGAQALESAQRHRPSLVLLDKNMPGMNCQDIIRALRAQSGGPLPILILSGEPVAGDELNRLNADGAVQKPFDVAALVAQIRQHLPG